MATNDKPSFYRQVSEQFPEVIDSVERLGATLRTAGPLDVPRGLRDFEREAVDAIAATAGAGCDGSGAAS